MRTPIETLALELLNAAGWPAGSTPPPHEFMELSEHVGGAIERTLPTAIQSLPPARLAIKRDAGAGTLLVLERSEPALYRFTLELRDNEQLLGAERLDLERQIENVRVTERHWSDSGRPIVTSRWEFTLKGATEPLVVDDETTSDGVGPLGKDYRFGRAIAEATGWPPETPDEPFVEVTPR